MPRIKFNDGQEITYEDQSKISAALELELYDRILKEVLGRQQNFVFNDSFAVTYVNSTTVAVAAGNGMQYDATQTDPEPMNRPLYLASSTNKTIAAADATNNRIDIVSIKANRATTLTGSRNQKSAVDGSVASATLDLETDWSSDLLVTAGTPAASPAVPSTPAGYIKLAEILVTAAVGVSGSNSVTDKRVRYLKGGGKLQTKTAAYTMDVDDRRVLANAAGGNFAITLPLAASCYDATSQMSVEIEIKNIGVTGTVTVTPQGAETIDGAATQTLDAQYSNLVLYSNGSNWFLS